MTDRTVIQLTLDRDEFMYIVAATSYVEVSVIPGASEALRAQATVNVVEDLRALGRLRLTSLIQRMVALGDSAFGGEA